METRHGTDNGRSRHATALSRSSEATSPDLTEKAKREAKSRAQDAKQQVAAMADMGRDQVAGQLEAVSRAFKTSAEQLRAEGQEAGSYVEAIGEQADRAARYLRDRDAAALTEDVSRTARANPALFLGGCALVGFAIGRFLNASPPRREPELPARVTDPAWTGPEEY